MDEETYKRIEELSYDIKMSLQTGLPVNVLHENELMMLLEEGEECFGIVDIPAVAELADFLLDYDGDQGWNIKNMLVGPPVL